MFTLSSCQRDMSVTARRQHTSLSRSLQVKRPPLSVFPRTKAPSQGHKGVLHQPIARLSTLWYPTTKPNPNTNPNPKP